MEKIIKEILEGNKDSFNEFYEKTKDQIFYNIFAILKDESLSEDALQETYIRFLKNLNKVKDKNALGYLFVISRNIAINIANKAKYEVVKNNCFFENTSNLIADRNNANEIIGICKRVLKNEEFEIVILHIVNEMTHKDISLLLKKPLGTITWAYNNAIKKLQKELRKYE